MSGFGGEGGLRSTFVPNSTPGRSLNTNFQPSSTRPVFVSYTVRINLEPTVQSQGRVELLSDASNPPTNLRCQVRAGRAAGSVASHSRDSVLCGFIPAGHFVRLNVVTESGTPTITLIAQTETIL